jgi:hypothetical protein
MDESATKRSGSNNLLWHLSFFRIEAKMVKTPFSQYLDFLKPTIPKELIFDASFSGMGKKGSYHEQENEY